MNRTKLPPSVTLREAPPDALAAAAITKLRRLLRMRRDHSDELRDEGLRLLDVCIVACIEDARDAGAGDRVAGVIRDVRRFG